MPVQAEILKVATQKGFPCMWVMVDPDAHKEARSFTTIGTGHGINTSVGELKYLDTYQTDDGYLVWHLFERI